MKKTKFLLLLLPVAAAAVALLPTPTPFAGAEVPVTKINASGTKPAQVEVAGIRLPQQANVADTPLVLNGTALRTKFGFKVYVAGLYLKEACNDCDKIMSLDRASKRVHITMMREIKANKFKEAVCSNIDANFSGTEKRQYASEISAFLNCFPDGSSLSKSARVDIDFLPGEGTRVMIDDRPAEIIPGDDFYHVLLRLWIGKPLQPSIKEGLLAKG